MSLRVEHINKCFGEFQAISDLSMEVNAGALFGFLGGGAWQSAAYALWDSLFSVGMVLGLFALFRRFFNGSSRFSRFLTRHAYTVFIIHAPILVLLAVALRGLQMENLLKFGLLAIMAVPLCFAAAYGVRKLPFAARIL